MTRVHAPYNFVPLSDFVYRPIWAGQVSHDIPFSNGLTGQVTLEIETVTPLFVGGHKEDSKAGEAETGGRETGRTGPNRKTTFTWDDKPAIPGASLRGMLRNVIEIATFGAFQPRIDNRRYSIRDLHNPLHYLQHMTEDYGPLSRAGWLYADPEAEGAWRLQACDFAMVRQEDLERYYQDRFSGRLDLGRRQTAGHKYRQWEPRPLDIDFHPAPLTSEGDWAKGRLIRRASQLGSGGVSGTVVLTGQPQNRFQHGRPNKSAKKTEFIFFREDGQRYEDFRIEAPLREAFEAAHRDANTRKPNDDWARWRRLLMEKQYTRVPVFWLPTEDKQGIRALGLAMMFRLPYNASTHDLAFEQQGAREGPDFADLLFGYLPEEPKGQALKGRIQFEHAIQIKPGDPADEVPVALPLLTPKPNYYPAYLAQNRIDSRDRTTVPRSYPPGWDRQGAPDYTTYMDSGEAGPAGRLRGWKRYPVSTKTRKPPEQAVGGRQAGDNQSVMTELVPVGRGARFRTRLHVFNLKPEELGAVIWALTWGNSANLCHSLGGGRPYGYGVVRIHLIEKDTMLLEAADWQPLEGTKARDRVQSAVSQFTTHMEEVLRPGWASSPQIRELLAMADPETGDDRPLEYMTVKEYQQAKKKGALLPLHSGAVDPGSAVSLDEGVRQKITKNQKNQDLSQVRILDGEKVKIVRQDGADVTIEYLEGPMKGDLETVSFSDLG